MKCQACDGHDTQALAAEVPQADGGKANVIWCRECGTVTKMVDYGHTIKNAVMVPRIVKMTRTILAEPEQGGH